MESAQGLQVGGRQQRPPPLQTGINAKLLKISPIWRRLSIGEMLLYPFAEFELYPSHIFRENPCWNHAYSFLNMIGAKLSDQRNPKHAGRFKFTNQRLASRGSPPRFKISTRWLVNLKRPACFEFFWSLSLAPIILRKLYAWFQHGFSRKMCEG